MLQQPAHTGQASRPSLFTSTVHACKQPAKLNQKGVIMSFATCTATCPRPCIVLRLCRLRVASRACHSNLRRTNNNEGTKATRNKQTNERTNERANERSFEPLTDFHVLTHSQSLSVSHCQSVTVSQSLSVSHCQSVTVSRSLSVSQPLSASLCSDYDNNDIALHCIALCIAFATSLAADHQTTAEPPNHATSLHSSSLASSLFMVLVFAGSTAMHCVWSAHGGTVAAVWKHGVAEEGCSRP